MDAGPSPVSNAPPSAFAEDVLVPSKPLVDDARFDVTAMVDLVFMMNIFFLVTWVDMALAEIDLPAARHCAAADKEESVVLTITKGPRVYLGDAQRRRRTQPRRDRSAGDQPRRGRGPRRKGHRLDQGREGRGPARRGPRRRRRHRGQGAKKLMLAVIEKK